MKKMKSIVTGILSIILVISTTYYIYLRYNEFQERKQIEELRNYTEQITQETEEPISIEENEEVEETIIQENTQITETQEKEILNEYAILYSENADLYGWLKIEDTVIDYPVMYTSSEKSQFYLHRDWNKEESKSGLLFADERTNVDETENTIIYGHCMKNRSMFGTLKDYKNIDFYEEHKYIEFDTIYEKAIYEIVSVSKGIAYYDNEPEDEYLYYKHTELDSLEDFDEYIQNAKDNAYFETGVTAEYGDKLITLSTCDYWTENARLYIVAKKISKN